ncbi:acireductone synthase [Synechococcus sp. CS-1325]|uniref:acireductone synthase n=1 Tax=Synechococcus sp. CS-1325 TaxID=2847979 RepID=UPI00223A7AB8|nr:acireductone synthase [Synechococcus sp. CS-1325]MCT0198948.1 acireductone synthase [Synechococcus sp. CS-1325]
MAESITHVLLDIEGTTCPVAFVADTLFLDATSHLKAYLISHAEAGSVQSLLREVQESWRNDQAASETLADGTADAAGGDLNHNILGDYLIELINQDRKLPALKELQGMIWAEGYREGRIKAALFPEVAMTLQQWHRNGLVLGVYSSGSVSAQQLLYANTTDGDLQTLFSAWFDTRTGAKQAASSYRSIADVWGTQPGSILFVSDSIEEVNAAQAAGMQVAFSDREGNPHRDAGSHLRVSSLEQLSPLLIN